ncbi:MAG: hypothetical protein ACRDGJ_08290 [Candidatus Limnocylindria bacterium]
MAHMEPLPKDSHPELAEAFATFEQILGFVPNSLLTMQRKPMIVQGFEALTQAVMDPGGEVDAGFKRLLAHVASRAAVVEMLAGVCLYGFLNRWNDTMATELEEAPRAVRERYLASTGWDGGKHVRH